MKNSDKYHILNSNLKPDFFCSLSKNKLELLPLSLKPNNMKFNLITSAFLMLFLVVSLGLRSQNRDSSSTKVFNLGTVEIAGTKRAFSSTEVKSKTIEMNYKSSDLDKAIDGLPGIIISNAGSRNEALIYVNGFDVRQVQVFIDGVPVCIPQDGYIDPSRLLSSGVAAIDIQQVMPSILYGANVMGGAINIISSRPAKPFFLKASTGAVFSREGLNGSSANWSLGLKRKKFYVDAHFALRKRNFVSLSQKFDTTALQKDFTLDNSFSGDLDYGIKAAFTPNSTDEYVLNYSAIRSNKGIPVYLGEDSKNKIRYWQFPKWNRDFLFFHSKTKVAKAVFFKSKLAYDKFDNTLKSFDDNSYSSQNKRYAFTSIYDDYSITASTELDVFGYDKHSIKFGIIDKYDKHSEYNEGEKPRDFIDNTLSLAAEDNFQLNGKTSIIAGVGYFYRKSLKATDYDSRKDSVSLFPTSDDGTFNLQAGIVRQLSENHKVIISMARKSRFATIKDRYSYRAGKALPNPGLKSETANSLQALLKGKAWKLSYSLKAYYFLLDNVIQIVNDVEPGKYQFQNTGKAYFSGLDLALKYPLARYFSAAFNYSFIERKNLSNPEIFFVDVPRNSANFFLEYNKEKSLYVKTEVHYRDKSYSNSNGLYTAPSYWLLDVYAGKYLKEHFLIRAGIYNIFDVNYYLSEGYPEEGRVFSLSLSYEL